MESKLTTVPEPCTGSRRGAVRPRGRVYNRTSKVTKFRKKPTMDAVDGSLVWFAIVCQRWALALVWRRRHAEQAVLEYGRLWKAECTVTYLLELGEVDLKSLEE
jgi:hypothetical protein